LIVIYLSHTYHKHNLYFFFPFFPFLDDDDVVDGDGDGDDATGGVTSLTGPLVITESISAALLFVEANFCSESLLLSMGSNQSIKPQ
jgi:hypothetical protein